MRGIWKSVNPVCFIHLILYRLWRRWFRLYGPGFRVPNCLLLPPPMLFPRSLPTLNWYFWISGISRSDVWLITKSSLWLSSDFNLASIALIVSSLLILLECEVPAARTGISTFVFGLSISSCIREGKLILWEKVPSIWTYTQKCN